MLAGGGKAADAVDAAGVGAEVAARGEPDALGTRGAGGLLGLAGAGLLGVVVALGLAALALAAAAGVDLEVEGGVAAGGVEVVGDLSTSMLDIIGGESEGLSVVAAVPLLIGIIGVRGVTSDPSPLAWESLRLPVALPLATGGNESIFTSIPFNTTCSTAACCVDPLTSCFIFNCIVWDLTATQSVFIHYIIQ